MAERHATAVLTIHRTGEPSEFAAFAEVVGADAERSPGFVGWQRSVISPGILEWGFAITFLDEPHLQNWLDRARDLFAGHGFPRTGLAVFLEGLPVTPGVVRVRDMPDPDSSESLIETAERLAALERERPGHEGSILFPPGGDDPDAWSSVIRFRTDDQLDAWLSSPERVRALPDRPAKTRHQWEVMTATSFGSTVRVADGKAAVTPEWKSAMTILLVLYPMVMLIGRFLSPLLANVFPQPWVLMFVSLTITTVLLSWVVMPVVGRIFGRWLDPVTGAGTGVSLAGAAIVCAGYLVFLAIFWAFPSLRP